MGRAAFGPYELVRKLAAGDVSEVYLARHWGEAGFFRDLVVKRLLEEAETDPAVVDRFQFEARLLAHFSHPNLPQVYNLNRAEDRWFLAMEYVDGPTVADLWRGAVRQGKWVPVPVAAALLRQVAWGLSHVHGRSDRGGRHLAVVHGNVSPHTVLMTRDGVVKIMGFSAAQTTAQSHAPHRDPRVTGRYWAPEQVNDGLVGQSADIYALGAMMYEMTTGARLFEGDDLAAHRAAALQPPVHPSIACPGYPEDLATLVMTAISRDPQHRKDAVWFAEGLRSHAMRQQQAIDARVVAEFIESVFPYTRAEEPHLAMVPAQEPFESLPADDAPDVVGARGAEHALDPDQYLHELERRLSEEEQGG